MPVLVAISHKDTADLDKVQKRANKMTRGLDCLSYEERPESLEMFHLEKKKKLSGGIIEVYKIIHQVDKVDRRSFSPYYNIITCIHPMVLMYNRFKTDKKLLFRQ